MDYLFILFFLITLIFGSISIYFDIKTRKVPNYITFTFFFLSFILFIYFMKNMVWFDFILVFITILISYYIYKKLGWGAADGKIFISLTLLIFAFGTSVTFLRFILNLVVIYSLTMTLVVFLQTTKKQKLGLLKAINYREMFLLMLIIFVLISLFFLVTPMDPNNLFILFFILILVLVGVNYIRKFLKPYIHKLDNDTQLFLSFTLFALLLVLRGGSSFIIFFFIVILFRVLVIFVSELTDFIKHGKNHYQSPFTLYLFLITLFTFLVNRSVIEIFILFIS